MVAIEKHLAMFDPEATTKVVIKAAQLGVISRLKEKRWDRQKDIGKLSMILMMLICKAQLILGAPRAKSKLHPENTMKKSYKSVSMEPAYVMNAPWEILILVALLVNPIELQHTHLQNNW